MNSLNSLDIINNTFPKSLNNSLVFTITDDAPDLPLDIFGSSNIYTYIATWVVVGCSWIYIYKDDYLALFIGFIIGLLLLQFKKVLYNSQLVGIMPWRTPDPKLKFTYVPEIGNSIKDVNLKKLGNWQILLKNDFNLSSENSYIWPAKTYLEHIKNNKIKATDYPSWLNQDANKLHNNIKTDYNPDTQMIHLGRFFDYDNIVTTIYYVMLTVITYGIYISDAKLTFTNVKNKKLLPWILLVMLSSLSTWIVGFYIPGIITIDSIQKSINLKENLTILVISFAITAVLIV